MFEISALAPLFILASSVLLAGLVWWRRRRRITLGGLKRALGPAPGISFFGSFRADASAYAPKTLRRGVPELVQVFVHRPKDQTRVTAEAKIADSAATRGGSTTSLGRVSRGASIRVQLEASGARVEALSPDQAWVGEPLTFLFEITADDAAERALIKARVLVDGAHVASIAFGRPVLPGGGKAATEDGAKAEPVRSVFMSYASPDRERVSLVAGAYQRAGIACFFDRTGLRPGEEWSPRLLQEIEKVDVFHLFWSQAASKSTWVEKEALHAIEVGKDTGSGRPTITIQMLDGPPWAKRPASLDHLHFDDLLRAAVSGYKGAAG